MSYERDPSIHTKVEGGFDVLSLETSCRADQLSERLYGFLQEPGWSQGEQVFGFLVNALREFYGYSPLDRTQDLVHAVIFARKYVLRLLQEDGGPYASKRIAAMKSQSTSSKRDFYASLSPAETAEDDKWIEEQVTVGRKFGDIERNSNLLPVFADSFEKAESLLSDVIYSAEELRSRQGTQIGSTPEADNSTFPNINLDTNHVSISGHYDLADCTALQLIGKTNAQSPATAVSYPTKTGDLAPYFAVGQRIRATAEVTSSLNRVVLQAQLQKIAQILTREHEWTHDVMAIGPAWQKVKFTHQAFSAAGGCPVSSAVPFGTETNVCIAPRAVYWHGKVRALTLLFAAGAAAHFTATNASTSGLDEALAGKREAVELFRLCDINKKNGYLDATFCKNGELNLGHVVFSEACVNQN